MLFQLSDPDRPKVALLANTFMLIAYKKCRLGGRQEIGMGFLQAVSSMDEDSIRNHIVTRQRNDGWTELYGDHVAGRMVKTGIKYNSSLGLVEISDGQPDPGWQGWCTFDSELNSYESLLIKAASFVGVFVMPKTNPAT